MIGHEEPGTAVVAAPGGAFIVSQQARRLRRRDLASRGWRPVPGATLAGHQLQDNVRVLRSVVSVIQVIA
jgi:hypothetical protein